MTNIQSQIRCYLGDKSAPSERDLLAFVGMLETGEATADDFVAVGGPNLALLVACHLIVLQPRFRWKPRGVLLPT